MSTVLHHAEWLAYHAGQLRAAIGAGDPHQYEGLADRIAKVERDLSEIHTRYARYAVKEAAE